MCKGPQGRPAVPGDSVLCARARRVDQMSRATRACSGRPTESTSPPGPLGPVTEIARCRPAVQIYSRLCRRDRGFNQLFCGSGMSSRSCRVDQLSRSTHAHVGGPAVSTSCPGRLRPVNEAPRCGPVFPGDSGPGPRAHGVEHLSRVTRVRVRGPAVSTTEPNNSGPAPRARGYDQMSRATRARVRVPMGSTSSPGQLALLSEVPQGQPAVLGVSGPGLSSHGVDSFHGRLVPGSEGPWFRPAVLDESRPCASSQGVHQLSRSTQIWFEGPRGHQLAWTTHARVRGPAGSTSSPGRLGPGSECPGGR